MNVELAILDVTERGAKVTLADGSPFWLPRSCPGLEWSAPPEIGTVTWVRLPRWLIAKHRQLSEYAYQRSMALYHPGAGLAPHNSKELPMADETGHGALFRIPEDQRKNDKWPEMRGDLTLPDGIKWELAGWAKTDRNGKRYLSLVAKPPRERQQQRQPERQQTTYAQATGRAEPQRQPAGGPTFADDEQIPFSAEWR